MARADFKSLPIGFSSTTRVFLADQAVAIEIPADRAVEVWRGGEVERADAVGPLVEHPLQRGPAVVAERIDRDVEQVVEEPLELASSMSQAGTKLTSASRARARKISVLISVREAPMMRLDSGICASREALVEGRQQFSLGQVPVAPNTT